MDQRAQPIRRPSRMRLLAAALAGAIGAFGVPAAAAAAPPSAAAVAGKPPLVTPDGNPK